MKIKTELLGGLKVLGFKQAPALRALQPQLEIALSLDEARFIGGKAIPDMTLSWSGFQLLETNVDLLEVYSQAGFGPYAMSGGGNIQLSSRMIEVPEGEDVKKMECLAEDMSALCDYICQVFKFQYEMQDAMSLTMTSDWITTSHGVGIMMAVTAPCAEEHWMQMYQLHKLETDSAFAYLEKILKQPVMPMDAHDMASNRILN